MRPGFLSGLAVALASVLAAAASAQTNAGNDQWDENPLILEVANVEVFRDVREKPPGWVVGVKMTPDSARNYALFTLHRWGKVIQVFVDGRPFNAPRVNEPIVGGIAWIYGDFDFDTATALASRLEAHSAQLSVRGKQQ